MIKKIFVVIVLLTSTQFFSLSLVTDGEFKVIEAIVLGLLIASVALGPLLLPPEEHRYPVHGFKVGVWLILAGVALSGISAYFNFAQPMQVTLVTQRFMYYYFLFFFLHEYRVDPALLKDVLLFLGLTFSIIYFASMADNSLVTTQMMAQRDTLRIALPGILFLVIGLFISLQRAVEERRYVYFLLFFLFTTNIIVDATRSVMLSTLLAALPLLYVYLKRRFVGTIAVLLVGSALSAFYLYGIVSSVWSSIIGAANLSDGNFAVRILAVRYFFAHLFPNSLSYLFGNGVASQLTTYGQQVLQMKNSGYYQSDIGIVGDYTRFGMPYLLGVITLCVSVLRNRRWTSDSYVVNSFYFIMISAITLSNFGIPSHIAAICVLLYLFDSDVSASLADSGNSSQADQIGEGYGTLSIQDDSL